MIKRTAKIMLPLFLCVALVTGGAYSLLETKTEKITNTFEYVYTEIELQEPSWEPNDSAYEPGQIIPKDPLVYNGGGQEAYMYISVFTPENLFSYNINTEDWEFITEHNETVTHKDETYNGKTAYYSYKQPVGSMESTSPLFTEATFVSYDVDYENYLEDEEKEGRGSGSAIVGKTHPIIVNAYAVTTDIDDDMLNNSVTDVNSTAYNFGRMRAWEYFREQTENSGDTHRCINAVISESDRTVDIYDLADNKLGEVTISSCGNETLNVDFVNKYLSEFGKSYSETNGISIPLYMNEDEMYYFINLTDGSKLNSETPVVSAENFRLNINLQYAVVYITFMQNGTECGTARLLFENGSNITTDAIQEKLLTEYGISVSINETINETASYENRYNLTVEITEE